MAFLPKKGLVGRIPQIRQWLGRTEQVKARKSLTGDVCGRLPPKLRRDKSQVDLMIQSSVVSCNRATLGGESTTTSNSERLDRGGQNVDPAPLGLEIILDG